MGTKVGAEAGVMVGAGVGGKVGARWKGRSCNKFHKIAHLKMA